MQEKAHRAITAWNADLAIVGLVKVFGRVLHILGMLEGNRSLLNEAVGIYNAALKVFKRDRFPDRWSETKRRLALTLQDSAELTRQLQ